MGSGSTHLIPCGTTRHRSAPGRRVMRFAKRTPRARWEAFWPGRRGSWGGRSCSKGKGDIQIFFGKSECPLSSMHVAVFGLEQVQLDRLLVVGAHRHRIAPGETRVAEARRPAVPLEAVEAVLVEIA